MGRVWEAIQTLAEAQQRTEERLEELAQAQARTEERVSKRRLTGALIEKPYMAYIFGLRVYPEVVAAAEEAGIGVLDFRGERVAAVVRS